MTEAEKTLIAGCVRGDKAAWDGFVQQFSSLVYSTIYKTLTLHHSDLGEHKVEDLYQEFLIAILQNDCRKLAAQEEARSLAAALESLSARDRLIIVLAFRRSLSAEDSAAILKTSVGAFYTQKSRVLDKLREILGKTSSL
jgi:DNA-directed RNA polymerase specialized sigma24 family protein